MDDEFERRVRERAHKIWEEEGRPQGRDAEHWEKARTLVAIEMEPEGAAQLPNPIQEQGPIPHLEEPVEPVREALENQGEFPDRFADQGEKTAGPVRRRRDTAAQRQAEPPVATPKEEQHPPAKLTGRRKKPG